jgi:hypothetical protein
MGGTPKSSILIGISTINHPFWSTPIYGNPLYVPRKRTFFVVNILKACIFSVTFEGNIRKP